MENKDWDSYLQRILGEFEANEDSHWEDLNSKLNASSMDPDKDDVPSDEVLRESLSEYKPTDEIQGWEALASSLDQADKAFDKEINEKVKHYNAPHDPDAWSLFLKNFSAYKALRLKLIALKAFEASAVLLLVFTVFQMHQKGAFQLYDQQEKLSYSETATESSNKPWSAEQLDPSKSITGISESAEQSERFQSNGVNHLSAHSTDHTSLANGVTGSDESGTIHTDQIFTLPFLPSQNVAYFNSVSDDRNDILSDLTHVSAGASSMAASHRLDYVTETLAQTEIGVKNNFAGLIPYPVYVKPASKKFLEFGMLAQVDFNTLKMPQDILYTNRKQFVFPLQGLPCTGYGAGFTVALVHNRWAVESGVIYNSKTFKPGRSLTVGEATDHSKVEFDAMQIQIISAPIQLRYKITPQNRFQWYAIAGVGMHIIAQSDIDVDVNYNFSSLPVGENPNNHPALAKTIRESQRLRDNFRQKAPFSTKSFITANLGLGFEYAVAARKSLFLQSTYQYQIPNLRFSNHNGKQLVSTAIQVGVRTPLGY